MNLDSSIPRLLDFRLMESVLSVYFLNYKMGIIFGKVVED